jgi:hypothetical protein
MKNLKAANYPLIGVYVTAVLVLGYAVLFQVTPSDTGVASINAAVGATASVVVAIILAETLSSEAKARLIYCRWHQAMPGFRAFTVYIHEDALGRINKASLTTRYGALPSDAGAQNRLWYGMLQQNGEAPSVAHAHQRFLLFRDLTWVTLICFVVATAVALRLGIDSAPRIIFLGGLFAVLLLLWIAAARFGRNLVKTVLAVESHRKDAA